MESIPSDGECKIYPKCPKYLIYKDGRVKSIKTGKFLKQRISSGYPCVSIDKKPIRVHRLVALTFIDNPDSKKYVDHIDGDRTNSILSNLNWVTPAENSNKSHKKSFNVTSVIQYRDDENIEIVFPSIAEASIETGTSRDMISWCCQKGNENKVAKDENGKEYKWRKYTQVEDEPTPDFKPHPDFINYLIGPSGEIYSLKKKRFIKPFISDNYMRIGIYIGHTDGKRILKNKMVHRLVAETYIENKPEGYDKMDVNHIDGNKLNNHYTNLEYLDKVSHAKHTVKTTLKNCKSVLMIDPKTNEIVNKFISAAEAGRYIGKTSGHICNVCRGLKKSAGGYLFKYE